MNKFAVLTGDLVKSSRGQEQRDILLNVTKNILKNLGRSDNFLGGNIYTSRIFRGDSFQLIITDSLQSLRLSLFIRSEFLRNKKPGMNIDTRLGVGIGSIESLDIKKVEESYGEAFQLSGEALDYMARRKYQKYRRLRILTPENKINNILDTILACLDAISNRWSVEQAEAVSLRLMGKTQTEIAKIIQVSQEAIQQRMKIAGYYAVEQCLGLFRQLLESHNKILSFAKDIKDFN